MSSCVFAEGVAEPPLRLAQLGDHIDGAQGAAKDTQKTPLKNLLDGILGTYHKYKYS